MTVLLIILLILTFFILLGVGLYRGSGKYAVAQRIEQIQEEEAQTTDEELQKPFMQRIVLPLGDFVARLFRGFAPQEVSDRMHKKLVMAGLYPRVTPSQF
ncbi:MAG: hypothetical protein GWN81_02665, partial [Phycisphaerae bacterium]|nr:hypothetical protein [Phycisphaerae bacterium]